MIDRLLQGLAKLCLRHSKSIAIISALLGLAAIVAASRLKFDPDLLNLIPQNNKQVNEFRTVLSDMGTIDNHIVVLHMPPDRDVREYETLIDAIAQGYAASPRIADVNYRLPNPLDFVEIVLPRAMLFLTPEELRVVEEKLTDEAIRQSVVRNRALLQTPQSFAIKQLIQYDPFNLAPIFLKRFQAASGGFKMDAASGYYLSADRSMLLILTKPKRPAQDVPFGKELLAEASIIEGRALADFQEKVPAGTPMPRIEHTGGYQIAVSDASLIRKDVLINVVGSVVGVLALFLYGFRRAASLFYAAAPMALGLALTFGVAALVYGTLSSASAGFAALLAGLGIDFITVFYGRYVDERNQGATMPHALIVTIKTTMPGIAVAAVTTATTFYAFLATDFRGMTQLGFLTGTGILFFLLSVAFLLPALLVLSERHDAKRAPRLFFHSFGADKLIDVAVNAPRATVALWAGLVVICSIAATQIRFSDNIQNLRAKGNEGVINQARVTSAFGQSFDVMMYVVKGATLEDVLERTRVVTDELKPLVTDRAISSYQAITTFIPPHRQQREVMAFLEAGRSDAFNIDRIDRTFRAALAANGFRPEVYDSYLRLFGQALQPKETIALDKLDNEHLQRLTTRFVKQANGQWMSVIYLYPAGPRWPREVPAQLLQVAARHPGDVLTGVNLMSGTLRRIVKADAVRATTIGFFAVLLIMAVAFRNVKMTALSFVPFLAGGAGMLGFMALLGLEFNFMNIFVALMIISCGTDYAVYMQVRYLENPQAFRDSAHQTGKAVVMAALMTVVGYGSFALSSYPGLRSIGYASTFGIGLSGLAAITLLPAILVLTKRTDNDSDDSAGP